MNSDDHPTRKRLIISGWAAALVALVSTLWWMAPRQADDGPAGDGARQGLAMNGDPQLVGTWQRTNRNACAASYAATLHIDANGLYSGTPEQTGEFTWWDAGTWRVNNPGQLALSVANDEVITYGYMLTGDVLTITDADGCRVAYRRSG